MAFWVWAGGKVSHEHEAHVARDHRGAAPVVKIVMELSVSNAKLVVGDEFVILHDVECVKDIKVPLLCDRRENREGQWASVSTAKGRSKGREGWRDDDHKHDGEEDVFVLRLFGEDGKVVWPDFDDLQATLTPRQRHHHMFDINASFNPQRLCLVAHHSGLLDDLFLLIKL